MLGYITIDEKGASDRLLAEFARQLKAKNIPLAGAIQINDAYCDSPRAKMVLEILANDETITISQDLGPFATGCRLDAEGLETAAQSVFSLMTGDESLLILNKFGKQERDGQGFRDAIVKALDLDVPVLLGVNESLRNDFLEFAGDFATKIDPTIEALTEWHEKTVP